MATGLSGRSYKELFPRLRTVTAGSLDATFSPLASISASINPYMLTDSTNTRRKTALAAALSFLTIEVQQFIPRQGSLTAFHHLTELPVHDAGKVDGRLELL